MIATSAAAAGAAVLGATGMPGADPSTGDMRPHVNFALVGKSAIVTGAARGIGRAISIALAAAGADVMGIDICASPAPSLVCPPATKEDLDETGRLVEEQKKRFIGLVADTRDFAALKG